MEAREIATGQRQSRPRPRFPRSGLLETTRLGLGGRPVTEGREHSRWNGLSACATQQMLWRSRADHAPNVALAIPGEVLLHTLAGRKAQAGPEHRVRSESS